MLNTLATSQQVKAQDGPTEPRHGLDGLPVGAQFLGCQRALVGLVGAFVRLGVCAGVVRDVVALELHRNAGLGSCRLRCLVCRPHVAAQLVGRAGFAQFDHAAHHVCNLFARHQIGGQGGDLGPRLHHMQLKDASGVLVRHAPQGLQVVAIVGQQGLQCELCGLQLGGSGLVLGCLLCFDKGGAPPVTTVLVML